MPTWMRRIEGVKTIGSFISNAQMMGERVTSVGAGQAGFHVFPISVYHAIQSIARIRRIGDDTFWLILVNLMVIRKNEQRRNEEEIGTNCLIHHLANWKSSGLTISLDAELLSVTRC